MSCCPTNKTAVLSDYNPQSVPIYEAGNYKSKTAIISIVDIFGFSPQSKQISDLLGQQTDARVVMIDFFNNEPWKLENFPPKEGMDLMGWIGKYDFETVIKPIVVAQIEKLKYQGVETFYAIGFCWGAIMAYKLQLAGLVTKIACPHPSFFNDNLKEIAGPICFLPSRDEEPLEGFKATLMASPFAAESVWERFDTCHHGWMGARGDFKDANNLKEALRGLDIITKFFQQ